MRSFSNKHTALSPIGLGCAKPSLCLYTPHRPPLQNYKELETYRPATQGECAFIIAETGNHWRKIFSIFAKLAQAMFYPDLKWQEVRDKHLFTSNSRTALLWQQQLATPSQFESSEPIIHLIGGQAFAESFERTWMRACCLEQKPKLVLTQEEEGTVILTPYLDYRQFTNAMIAALLPVIRQHLSNSKPTTSAS